MGEQIEVEGAPSKRLLGTSQKYYGAGRLFEWRCLFCQRRFVGKKLFAWRRFGGKMLFTRRRFRGKKLFIRHRFVVGRVLGSALFEQSYFLIPKPMER